ncbi:Uncharacterised protein [Pannonibacter phragmitetus]|uniref:Uncharacterized protein n=1 Tax=Pannonibacter phragmitetus TaxID=121719 RepID=A0A378ZVT1_9HYPH|nr:hypothetical protein [Pannonibacter phragmitetus]SUB01267.1 Uncharacterised protein [Pannonibacter phragmitetus]
MLIDYLEEFPIPTAALPTRLRALLEPIGDNPALKVEVATRWDKDQYGPNREYVHMIMAAVPEEALPSLGVLDEAANGVVAFSVPDIENRGGLTEFTPSVSGHEYIVASWGNGSFYSYTLAEKVWMALGLSSRTLGGAQQRIIYDDLSLPEFAIAEGEISTQYYYSAQRSVQWTMSNEYLRRYLWMQGAHGVRVFFYEALLPDCSEVRSLMAGQTHVELAPEGGWYRLDLREFDGGLLIQVWASVDAVTPELCPEQTANGLIWPGAKEPMTHKKANALVRLDPVYLDDRFLERYEQSSLFDTRPVNVYGHWHCSPSYLGQWSFTDCVRVGRNLIRVPMRELYKPKPDREIVHAHAFALDPSQVTGFDLAEEHIVTKIDRFVAQLLELGNSLSALCGVLDIQATSEEVVGLCRVELGKNGWLHYPELSRLAQVAPLSMTEQAFLSRCKSIHELWQRIPNGLLRNLLVQAGHTRKDLKDLGSLKLMQALCNVLERLNSDGEQVDAFGSDPQPNDLTDRNPALAALFVNNDLRIADAHDSGGVLTRLEALGFDTAGLNQGYGRALDHVLDGIIEGFAHLNSELRRLLQL